MPATPTTSGVVSGVKTTVRQILDHGFRRAGILPARVSSESLSTAVELLYSLMTEWAAVGFPLWTKTYSLLSVTQGSADVYTPVGTVDIIEAFWRILQTYRGPATLSNGLGDILLFGGQPNTDVTVPGPNPGVTVNFNTPIELDTIGVLPGQGATYTAALDVYTSTDGIAYSLFQSLPSAAYSAMQWTYFDLDPVSNAQYVRLQFTGASTWVLNQLNFGLANGQDIPLGVLNIDDYYNLVNRTFSSNQPNSMFNDRQLNGPILRIWPVPSQGAFYGGTVTALMRRYIQDPGTLTNILEIPQRWIEATQWRLACRIMDEIPEEMLVPGTQPPMPNAAAEKAERYKRVTANAEKAETIAWGEERAKGPVRLIPDFSCYSR